jgi:hypothetical protein
MRCPEADRSAYNRGWESMVIIQLSCHHPAKVVIIRLDRMIQMGYPPP